jgi:hypothetical protein
MNKQTKSRKKIIENSARRVAELKEETAIRNYLLREDAEYEEQFQNIPFETQDEASLKALESSRGPGGRFGGKRPPTTPYIAQSAGPLLPSGLFKSKSEFPGVLEQRKKTQAEKLTKTNLENLSFGVIS